MNFAWQSSTEGTCITLDTTQNRCRCPVFPSLGMGAAEADGTCKVVAGQTNSSCQQPHGNLCDTSDGKKGLVGGPIYGVQSEFAMACVELSPHQCTDEKGVVQDMTATQTRDDLRNSKCTTLGMTTEGDTACRCTDPQRNETQTFGSDKKADGTCIREDDCISDYKKKNN